MLEPRITGSCFPSLPPPSSSSSFSPLPSSLFLHHHHHHLTASAPLPNAFPVHNQTIHPTSGSFPSQAISFSSQPWHCIKYSIDPITQAWSTQNRPCLDARLSKLQSFTHSASLANMFEPLTKVDSAVQGLSSSPPKERGHRRQSSSAAGVMNINDLGEPSLCFDACCFFLGIVLRVLLAPCPECSSVTDGSLLFLASRFDCRPLCQYLLTSNRRKGWHRARDCL